MYNSNDVFMKYNIYEFDFDVAIKKMNFTDRREFDMEEIKRLMIFLTGRIISKKEIKSQLNLLFNNDIDFSIPISKDKVNLLYEYYYKNMTDSDIFKAMISYYSDNSSIDLKQFIDKGKMLSPNLSAELLTKLFMYVSSGDSKIENKNIEKVIKN